MPHKFNDFSHQSLERITEALVDALAYTHEDLQPLGRALARATDKFFEAAYLASYGDDGYAADTLDICRIDIEKALALLPDAQSELVGVGA